MIDSKKKLAPATIRQHATAIFTAAIEAVQPHNCIRAFLKRQGNLLIAGTNSYDLTDYEKVFIVGAGKASAAMAAEVETLLEGSISGGLVITKYDHVAPLGRIELYEAAHPVPDNNGLVATQKMLRLLEGADDKTLVICLLSGGGSALLVQPVENITLQDKQRVTDLLLACGATIHEVNTVRKKISTVKGGGLAAAAPHSQFIALILSDVVGDDLQVIASGPTAQDTTTIDDCIRVFNKYGLIDRIPQTVAAFLNRETDAGKSHEPPVLPKQNRVQNIIVGSNSLALDAAAEKAAELGYAPLILSSTIEGEASEVAKVLTAIARESADHHRPVVPPACILSGGETTVTIRGKGRGGRNMELALAAAIELAGHETITLLSGGTDGTDGPTDAAGAFASGATLAAAAKRRLNAHASLVDNDSYSFFSELGDLFVTGPTRTNVMDLQIFLIASEEEF